MRNIKLTIEYDGTHFHGWQIQSPGKRTVQGEIARALKIIFRRKISLIGSGRTDSGVHAVGQVANFKINSSLSTDTIVRALNANLPEDIVIRNAKGVPSVFNAQFSAKRKTYRYTILNRSERPGLERDFVFHYPLALDVVAMRRAAKIIKGKKDFRSFMAADPADSNDKNKNTVRTISRLVVKKTGDLITIEVSANGFLYKMVRNIVGTLLEAGKRRINPHQVRQILDARNRCMAKATAPAKGLCLMKVAY